jgi:hypothetical protein
MIKILHTSSKIVVTNYHALTGVQQHAKVLLTVTKYTKQASWLDTLIYSVEPTFLKLWT